MVTLQQGHSVKHGFSELTKVQIGQGQYIIGVTKDCEKKALKEGCHERKQAWTDVSSIVSSIEKISTK